MKRQLIGVLTMALCLAALHAGEAAARSATGGNGAVSSHGADGGSSIAAKPHVLVRMLPDAAAVRDLAHGGAGAGYLLYYLPSHGVRRPSLIVKLVRARGAKTATAFVFQAPQGKHYVPWAARRGHIVVPRSERPAVVMVSHDGRWIRRGLPDLNLSVTIYSPFQAMWEPVSIARILVRTPTRQPVYRITTHAYPNGVPQWDLRELVPHFPGSGVLRTNYAQRETAAPLRWNASVSPSWPYVASTGGFLQGYGVENPPLVVDWKAGRISDFSEVTSVRAESAGYAAYSLTKLPLGKTTEPNFESPWGFYNLSGARTAYPDLVIRLQHNTANDPYYRAYGQASQAAPLYPFQSEDVRYSWSNQPGNLLFNYKLGVYGNVPYTQKTVLAGGALAVKAPGYAAFPAWVTGHAWPVQTFVDTEGHSYQTTEGIYEWPAISVGIPYVRGWSATPNLAGFQTIRSGFRGEYRVGAPAVPKLYLSPVDGRWHLLGAAVGVWNLGNGRQLMERNLTGGRFIDEWKLAGGRGRVLQRFVHLDGWSLYSGPGGSTWVKDGRPGATTVVSPPDNHASWLAFRRLAAAQAPRNPEDMGSWLPRRPSLARGVAIEDVTATPSGFRFVLRVSGPGLSGRLPGIGTLKPGAYVAAYDSRRGVWTERPAKRATPAVGVYGLASTATVGVPQRFRVTVRNTGDLALTAPLTVTANGYPLVKTTVRVGGHDAVTVQARWTPRKAGGSVVQAEAGGSVQRVRLNVGAYLKTRFAVSYAFTMPSRTDAIAATFALLLMPVVVLTSRKRWRKNER